MNKKQKNDYTICKMCINKEIKMSKDTNKNECLGREDETKYGEFISSFFYWIPLKEQKKKAKRLENITKNKR